MARIRVTPAQMVEDVKGRNKAVVNAMAIASNRAARRARTLLARNTPKDTGELKASWKVKKVRVSTAKRLSGELAMVENDAPHAGIIEKGARPHPVSAAGIAALHAWVWRHRKNFGIGRGKNASRRALGIAYAIANRIRMRGQKGTFFIEKSLPEIQEFMRKELEAELRKVASKKARKR